MQSISSNRPNAANLHKQITDLQKQLSGPGQRDHAYLGKLFRAKRTLKLRSSLHSDGLVVGSIAENAQLQILEVRGRRGNVVSRNLIGWTNLFDNKREECFVDPRVIVGEEKFLFEAGDGNGAPAAPAGEEEEAAYAEEAGEEGEEGYGEEAEENEEYPYNTEGQEGQEEDPFLAEAAAAGAAPPTNPQERGHRFIGGALANQLAFSDDANKLSLIMARSFRIGAGTMAIGNVLKRIFNISWLRVFAFAWAKLKQRLMWARAKSLAVEGKRAGVIRVMEELRAGHLSHDPSGGKGGIGGMGKGGSHKAGQDPSMMMMGGGMGMQGIDDPPPQQQSRGANAPIPPVQGGLPHPPDPEWNQKRIDAAITHHKDYTIPPHIPGTRPVPPWSQGPGVRQTPHDAQLLENRYEMWNVFPTRAYKGTFTDTYGYDAVRRQRDMDAATYRSVEAARAVNKEWDRMSRNVDGKLLLARDQDAKKKLDLDASRNLQYAAGQEYFERADTRNMDDATLNKWIDERVQRDIRQGCLLDPGWNGEMPVNEADVIAKLKAAMKKD